MINNLKIRNFKCFAEQSIEMAQLTLLVGANASGKSTVIQALLLMRQSYQERRLQSGQLQLNGPLVNVGTVLDAFSQTPIDRVLSFEITDEQESFIFRFNVENERIKNYMLEGPHPGVLRDTSLFRDEFNYLNAERMGPRSLFPIPFENTWKHNVGIRGEYTMHVLGQYRRDPAANHLAPLVPDLTESVVAPIGTLDEMPRLLNGAIFRRAALFEQARLWMREIIPNFDLVVNPITEADQVQALFSNIPGQDPVRPSNIGFGLIYTLPIVVAALVAPAGSVLIVENPEAHLHPRSQSAMGRFLAQTARAGVQVIVETHSDHVLNGIRVAVRQKHLPADDVAIQYFVSGDGTNPQQVLQPRMYPSGGIAPWPSGFFDQMDLDLTELL